MLNYTHSNAINMLKIVHSAASTQEKISKKQPICIKREKPLTEFIAPMVDK